MKTLLGLRITLYTFLILICIALLAYDFLPVIDLFYISGKYIGVDQRICLDIQSDFDIYLIFYGTKFLSILVFFIFVMISLISPDTLFKKYSSEFYLKLSGIITILTFILVHFLILSSLSERSFLNYNKYSDYKINFTPILILILFCVVYCMLEIFFNKLLKFVPIKEKELSYYGKEEIATTMPKIEQTTIEQPKKVNVDCNNELQNIEFLQKYKELLDKGVITQDEFEDKKKSLL
ncbi:MAG: SHOCT domain-containing protein [Clostridia bacterium]|nr:SHOCT domain-containing protein [Clostridia bacterium]